MVGYSGSGKLVSGTNTIPCPKIWKIFPTVLGHHIYTIKKILESCLTRMENSFNVVLLSLEILKKVFIQ